MGRHRESARRIVDALGFIDMTIYANDDSRPDLRWRNDEVLELLGMIRDTLTDDPSDPEIARPEVREVLDANRWHDDVVSVALARVVVVLYVRPARALEGALERLRDRMRR